MPSARPTDPRPSAPTGPDDGSAEGQQARRGTLYVVATPIGNLGDLTARASEVLGRVPFVAAEDTRRTRPLLDRLGAKDQRVVRLDAHAKQAEIERLIASLTTGHDVALVTDAGTPAISDPGSALVRSARAAGVTVIPLPGPSAVTAALSAAGFATTAFRFVGFLPRQGRERTSALAAVEADRDVVVFFESPHRIGRTLGELARLMPAREALIAREITKLHEELLFGELHELASKHAEREWLGELTIVLGPRPEQAEVPVDPERWQVRAGELLREGLRAKAAADLLSIESGLSRKEAYVLILAAKDAASDA